VVLEGYFENFQRFGHLEDVDVFAIPDRKTPPAAYARCQALKRCGMKISCPTLDEQEDFLRRVGFLPHLLPYDSATLFTPGLGHEAG
jgi:hypothetical protein